MPDSGAVRKMIPTTYKLVTGIVTAEYRTLVPHGGSATFSCVLKDDTIVTEATHSEGIPIIGLTKSITVTAGTLRAYK